MFKDESSDHSPVVLYIGCSLPCRSETFVFREIFALRENGWKVFTASVHEPEYQLGDIQLENLANESIRIYSQGIGSLLLQFSREFIKRPTKVLKTLLYSTKLALERNRLSPFQRFKLIYQAIAAISISGKITTLGITHIHAHMAHVPTSIALILGKHLQIPFSFTGHAADLFRDQTLLEEKLNRAAFCVCIGKWHREFYRSFVNLKDKRLPIVRCGVDTTIFKPRNVTSSPHSKVKIISVGRLVPKKGFDCLVSALNLLSVDNIEWKCNIIGDGIEKRKLDRLISKSKHSNRIHLIGKKNNDAVRKMIQESEIFVLPCCIDDAGDQDGIPVVLMEAMACELPVISTTLPSISELIENEINGLLISPENSQELAQALKKLIASPSLRAKLGKEGRKHIVDEFSLPLNIERLQSAFLHSFNKPKSAINPVRRETPMDNNKRKLLIVSPCRNEEKYMEETIQSVLSQTLLPTQWIIVDDGSTDGTASTLDRYAKKYTFIKVIQRANRGERSVGPGVVEAFYAGLENVDITKFNYLCKLDLDLRLPKEYFEILIKRMEANPRIGTCSGKAYFYAINGKLHSEKCGDEMSVGMTKLYRTECFQEIVGFVREVMWDGIDCHRCRMLGWIACSWDEPELRFIHLRPIGSSQKGILAGRMRHGFGQYFMGTGLGYIVASSFYRMTQPPYIIGGLCIFIGYLKSMLQNVPRYNDPEFRNFLRRYHRMCLMKGKRLAVEVINQEQSLVKLKKITLLQNKKQNPSTHANLRNKD